VHTQIYHQQNSAFLHTVILRVVCSFNNHHHLIPYAALSNRFHDQEWNVFTARYELNIQFEEVFMLPV